MDKTCFVIEKKKIDWNINPITTINHFNIEVKFFNLFVTNDLIEHIYIQTQLYNTMFNINKAFHKIQRRNQSQNPDNPENPDIHDEYCESTYPSSILVTIEMKISNYFMPARRSNKLVGMNTFQHKIIYCIICL